MQRIRKCNKDTSTIPQEGFNPNKIILIPTSKLVINRDLLISAILTGAQSIDVIKMPNLQHFIAHVIGGAGMADPSALHKTFMSQSMLFALVSFLILIGMRLDLINNQ